MQFKLQAKALNEALGVVGIVAPRSVTPQGGAGYLFVVAGQTCRIYSRDALHQVRVDVDLDEVDGEGAFVYPAEKVAAMTYLDGWIQFEAGHDEANDRYWVRYETEGGFKADDASFNPQIVMQLLDSQLGEAKTEHVFPAAVLREAIDLAKGYLAKPNDGRVEDNYKTMQLFDTTKPEWAEGDGTLFAADGVRACYVSCSVFKGKGLSIHGQHLSFLSSFLSKCEGDLTIKLGDTSTFAVNSKGQVLGWTHHVKQHGKYAYYPREMEGYVLKAPKELLTKALGYLRSRLDSKRDKIRISYTAGDTSLRFHASEAAGRGDALPVGVVPVEEEVKTKDGKDASAGKKGREEDFAINANVNHLLALIEPVKGHEVDLRVVMVPPANGRKARALFRTIEKFWLSENGKLLIAPEDGQMAHECEVTRFMPSKD